MIRVVIGPGNNWLALLHSLRAVAAKDGWRMRHATYFFSQNPRNPFSIFNNACSYSIFRTYVFEFHAGGGASKFAARASSEAAADMPPVSQPAVPS